MLVSLGVLVILNVAIETPLKVRTERKPRRNGSTLSRPTCGRCRRRSDYSKASKGRGCVPATQDVAQITQSAFGAHGDIFFRHCSSGTEPRRNDPKQASCLEILRFSNRPISTMFTPPLAGAAAAGRISAPTKPLWDQPLWNQRLLSQR